MNLPEPEPVNEASDMLGNHNRLIASDGTEGFPVEVVEMRMGDEDEVDRGKIMNFKARLPNALDHL